MERFSTSLIVREMQIRSTVSCHLTPVGLAVVKKSKVHEGWRGHGGKRTLVHTGTQTGAATGLQEPSPRVCKSPLHPHVHCGIIRDSQGTETTQGSFRG